MQLASETANQIIDTDDLAFSGVFFFLSFTSFCVSSVKSRLVEKSVIIISKEIYYRRTTLNFEILVM